MREGFFYYKFVFFLTWQPAIVLLLTNSRQIPVLRMPAGLGGTLWHRGRRAASPERSEAAAPAGATSPTHRQSQDGFPAVPGTASCQESALWGMALAEFGARPSLPPSPPPGLHGHTAGPSLCHSTLPGTSAALLGLLSENNDTHCNWGCPDPVWNC